MSKRFQKVDPVRRRSGSPVATSNPSRTSAATVAPPDLQDGQLRCPACRNGATPTPTGRLRKHRDLFDNICGNRLPEGFAVRLDELPPVVIPRAPTRSGGKRPDDVPSRLDVGSECRECGKWLPGERSLCGRCSIKAAS